MCLVVKRCLGHFIPTPWPCTWAERPYIWDQPLLVLRIMIMIMMIITLIIMMVTIVIIMVIHIVHLLK